jgi:alkyldihydroxyacetonephosphate synthase
MDVPNLRWWGWGTVDKGYSLEERPAFWSALREWLGLPDEAIERRAPPVSLEEISLRPPRLDDPVLASLRKLVGERAVRIDKLARVEHAYGKSYCDLVRLRAGYIPNPPDAVVYPVDQRQICSLLSWAVERDIAIVPFGGGSTVLGGVEPPGDDRPALTLDLANLDRVLRVDPVSCTARIQAGATGPEIESQLNAQGFTLGHFPESFEFSTLGGWIATRAAGQKSSGYGRIEDMTRAVRAVTPAGVVETENTPFAAGPSLLQLLVGSKGAYGVITEASMRIRPLPAVHDYRGILFLDLEDGIAACRDLVQGAGLHPSIVRLSDAAETTAHAALDHEQQGLRRLANGLLERYLKVQGYGLTSAGALLLLGFDGVARWVAGQWDRALEVCGEHKGRPLGRGASQTWIRDRCAQPYLRDTLLDHGIMTDTLEATTTWSNLPHLYESMVTAMRAVISITNGGTGYVMTHACHATECSASLRATFLVRQTDDPDPLARQEQWRVIEQATTDAVLAAGGTLSRFHDLDRDHTLWLREKVGPLGIKGLQALKCAFDPTGIMNPGVLPL